MYDIKFPQAVNADYIKQCVNCPFMDLIAETDTVYDRDGNDVQHHSMKCANLDACLRVACEVERELESEDEEDVWEEDKVN